MQEGVIRFMGTPQEILATDDPVVRNFVRGGVPMKPADEKDAGDV